ncbi:MAG: hypothetical protein AVDCRST_MAG13-3077, partial [uncultured Solirubrobacteraceae bacterium]
GAARAGTGAAGAPDHARQVPDRPLRRGLGGLQPDPHRRGARPGRRPARPDPARPVDHGPGGARPDGGRGRTGGPALPGGPVPRHGPPGVRGRGDEHRALRGGRDRHRGGRGGAGRQGDRAQRQGGAGHGL